MKRASFLIVLTLFSAVAPAVAQSDPTLVARTNALAAAIKAKDPVKVASFYAEDAITYGEGDPLTRGRAAIQKITERDIAGLATMTARTVDVAASGTLGYEYGTFTLPDTANAKGRTGHYLTVWKKIGGQWLIAYDTFSNDPQPKE